MARALGIGAAALFLSALFFWVMARLVDAEAAARPEADAVRLHFVRVAHPLPRTQENLPPRPLPPENLPQKLPETLPPPSPLALGLPASAGLEGLLPPADFAPAWDGEALALLRVLPTYPPHAAARGIEGWVLLEFAIAASGAASSIRVLDSEPPGVFEDAARRALARWKYRPQQRGGRPVARCCVRQMIRFRLEE